VFKAVSRSAISNIPGSFLQHKDRNDEKMSLCKGYGEERLEMSNRYDWSRKIWIIELIYRQKGLSIESRIYPCLVA